jgi:Cu(I)/Ag(I) efflux system protein CusF
MPAGASKPAACAARMWSSEMKIVVPALLSAALFLTQILAPARAQGPGQPEVVKAQVVKVDAPRGKVTLDHAPIKSIQMEAMVMPFKVKDAAALKTLKPGDQVRFSVAMQDDELLITRIEAVK